MTSQLPRDLGKHPRRARQMGVGVGRRDMRAAPSEEDAAADTRVFGYQACMSSNVAPGGSRDRLPSKKGGSPRGYRTHVRVLSCGSLCTPIGSVVEGLPACRRGARVTFTDQTDG